MSNKKQAQDKKVEGNTFFKNKEYKQAITKYSEAIDLDQTDVTFFSNRSACYAALEMWEKAADDGRTCIMTDKNFVKGYFRAAVGLKGFGNLEGASDAIKRGLGIDSANNDLKKMSREIDEASRMKKVDALLEQAETQSAAKEYQNAFKTLDTALRLDPESKKVNNLMDKVRPLYEKAEKHRFSNLDPKERIKEQGDDCFKAAKFEEAIKHYTKCLDAITDKSTDLALKVYGNRAAAFKQLSNFDGTIEDSTNVLEYRPDDVKALIRRAQAYEACERYKSSLQDVRQVLSYGPDKVGKSSFDLCNGMQHRLNKVIAQLKAQS